ncbi:hypothetical protein GCM10009116_03850 [Brevundimonas basaltis]|uniref:Uncharacterized protein n=1 Tax=Brevundimonas basaltis TaxID=472166 RepID=A0A7W8HZ97_9CAUL|nr:hypothetical protein [Brevundimonas basaltis]MBB5292654.1 hypothetical protein [Brevundimonas basaltis]
MSNKAVRGGSQGRRFDFVSLAPHALTVGAVFLAWQILIQPLVKRAPVEIAIRVAPGSPLAISRAAESELAAGRNDNAAALAREALARAPFDVRALRTVGLSEAQAGRTDQANDLLTLAGNWSLRDDPAHAWLIERRLRRGEYVSAFAHADTLARRRQDLWPQLFELFTVAATEDPPRALPVIANLLAGDAPWRLYYLNSLYGDLKGLRVALNLAVLLEDTSTPLKNNELHQLYAALLSHRQIDAIKAVRNRLNRPPGNRFVANGEFDDLTIPAPFQWDLIQKAGAVASIINDDDDRGDAALFVDYDGYNSAEIAKQLTLLEPGRYRFQADYKIAEGDAVGRMSWTIRCDGQEPLLSTLSVPERGKRGWETVAAEFSVPQGCSSQWLALEGRPADRRTPMIVWFDRVSVVPVGKAPG